MLARFAAAAALVATAGATPWSTQGTQLFHNGQPVVVHGFSTTCLEYLLRGVGMECWCVNDWAHSDAVIAHVDESVLNATLKVLTGSSRKGVVPGIRVPMTAAYWMDVVSPQWAANNAKYPHLSQQYQTLITSLVEGFTSKGVVVILDLHWNDDVNEQQPMALKKPPAGAAGNATANALDFWASLATKFASNHMVWYELYNEPHLDDMNAYIHGDDTYAGMLEMYNVVREKAPDAMVVIAGGKDWAFDADSLVQLNGAAQLTNVLWNFHPYMGPNQKGSKEKSAQGFDDMVAEVLKDAPRPVILTEFGQDCCATDGACFQYNGTWGGKQMGYVEAIITIAETRGLSWMPWAWRPGAKTSACESGKADGNDINGEGGNRLVLTTNTGGRGADFADLFARYFETTKP